MESVWMRGIKAPAFETLKWDIKTDVLIIGGGLAGILCADALRCAGVNYVLVEADKICSGITKNTTAKITLGHGLIYDKMLRRFGEEKTRLYYQAQSKAIDKYRKMCENINCDFEEKVNYVYSLDDREKLEREAAALRRVGCDATVVSELPLPFNTQGAVKVNGQAQFDPLKFAYEVAKDLNIFENTKVLELTDGGALTNHGRITAEKIIVATHFPFINKHGSYFLKMYQHRSYVLALSGAPDVDGMYVDEAKKGLSFRSYKGLLLLGGGSHRTGKQGGNWAELEEFARRHYPNASQVCRWATQDCMTLDGIPYIGRYSSRTRELYAVTGFNKWGMTSSMVAASILCDLVRGKENKYSEVFSPSRSILRPQLAVNAFESAVNLLTPTAPRCPHLGCALKYNKAEHSWDCPCHGSRFTEKGELIDNPATDDKRIP